MRTELEACFERFQAHGDVDALGVVFDRTAPRLFKVARHLVRLREEAEDLVQTTFLTAIQRAPSWDVERPLLPWLTGILLNHARGARRREMRAPTGEELASESSIDPRRVVEAAEFAQALSTALQSLPDTYREVLAAYLADGVRPREIAERLRRPQGTVRAQLHRGLRLLREALPAGMSLGLALLGFSSRSLARARERVLEHAREHAVRPTQASTAPPPPAGISRKLEWSAAAAAALVCTGLWWPSRAVRTDEMPSIAASGAEANSTTLSASAPGDAERVAVGTVTVKDAHAGPETAPALFGSLRVRASYPDGMPAAGIGLRLMVWGDPEWAQNVKEVVTAENGEALIDSLHPGRVGLKSDRGGDARALIRPGEETVFEWTVGGDISVSGVVVDPERRPVRGASISLSYDDAGQTGRIALACDDEGRFAVDHLAAYRVIGAVAPGYAPSDRVWIGAPMQLITRRAELELMLHRATGRLSGTVYDAGGRRIARPEIELESSVTWPQEIQPDGTILLRTSTVRMVGGEDGRFDIRDLRPSTYLVHVVARGYAEWRGLAYADERGELELDVHLDRSASVTGHVRWPDGSPAAGARVSANAHCAEGPSENVVGADGRYAIDRLSSGAVYMFASDMKGAMLPLEATLLARPGDALTWDAQFRLAQALSGRLVDDLGAPLEGWFVRAVPADTGARCTSARDWLRRGAPWASRRLTEWLEQKPAAADGSFRSNAIGPGRCALEVYAPQERKGPPVACFRELDAGASDLRLVIDSSRRTAATLRGTVRRADGRAVEHGKVLVRFSTHGGELQRRIEPSGAFELGPLPAGDVDLFVWAEGLPLVSLGARSLEEGEVHDAGVLTIAAPGAASIDLAGEGGRAIGDAEIRLSCSEGWSAYPRRLGSHLWRAEHLRPGHWQAEVRASGHETRTLELEILSAATTHVAETLRTGSTRRIEVVPPAVPSDVPRAMRELACEIRDAATGALVARQDVDPLEPATLVMYEGLAQSTYRVSARNADGTVREGSFEVPIGSPPVRPIRVRLE